MFSASYQRYSLVDSGGGAPMAAKAEQANTRIERNLSIAEIEF
jgi:hypothetical protein